MRRVLVACFSAHDAHARYFYNSSRPCCTLALLRHHRPHQEAVNAACDQCASQWSCCSSVCVSVCHGCQALFAGASCSDQAAELPWCATSSTRSPNGWGQAPRKQQAMRDCLQVSGCPWPSGLLLGSSSSPGIAPPCLQILGKALAQEPAAGVQQRVSSGDAVPNWAENVPPACHLGSWRTRRACHACLSCLCSTMSSGCAPP